AGSVIAKIASLLRSISSLRRSVGPRNQAEHAFTVIEIDHRREKAASGFVCIGTEFAKRATNSLRLQGCELESEDFAFSGRVQQTLPAILCSLFLRNVPLINQLLKHPTQRLLCDVEDLEQISNFDARIAVDEMEHAMVRATEAQLEEHFIRIADKVTVGKKQKLDDVPDGLG